MVLGAEVLYRLSVAPFAPAHEVLLPLLEQTVKEEGPDFLQLCHQLMREVLDLPDYLNDDLSEGGSSRKGDNEDTYAPFAAWLRCYSKEGMRNLRDGNGRTIWFQGPAGSLAPKGDKAKQVGRKKKYKVAKSGSDNQDVKEETEEEKDVKEEIKAKTGLKLKPTSERLKDEKPEKPLVREESVLKNKPVMRGRRKTDKSEINTGENGLAKTAQSEVPVKRVRRK